jgi:ferredoxin
MGYFSNGTEGSAFDAECAGCKYGEESCPIAFVQIEYNYEACNNKTARSILDALVSNDGTCAMKKAFSKDFKTDAHNLKIQFE